ncbi:Helix-turn-helix [Ralstonia mannitolilytica]|nr:Helix-turn-helix [Ralstonia mannitolilytica]
MSRMNGLIELRKRLRMSQAELGAGIGLGQSAISQCERGGCLLSPESAKRLIEFAKARGVTTSLDEIYSDDGPAHPRRDS